MYNKKYGGNDFSEEFFTIYESSGMLAKYSIIVDIINLYNYNRFSLTGGKVFCTCTRQEMLCFHLTK